MIDKNGVARLGDFGITGVITDPTVVELGDGTMSMPGARYMAPELLNPTQFHLQNSNPTKESDVYSLAMTAYEVDPPYTLRGRRRHPAFSLGSHRHSTVRAYSLRNHHFPRRDWGSTTPSAERPMVT